MGKRINGKRKYVGNPPDIGNGWEMIGRIEADGEKWIMFRQAQDHSPNWANYKIVADGVVEKKANYWLARNDQTGQIGFSRDFAMMREYRPALHQIVEEQMRDISKMNMVTA
jgi:hypothetical protein